MISKIKVILILIVFLISIIFVNVNALSETKGNYSISTEKITRNSENKLVISCNETYKILNHDNRGRAKFQINLTNYYSEEKIIDLGRKDENADKILVSFNPRSTSLQAGESNIVNIEMIGTPEIEIGIYTITIIAKIDNYIISNKLNLTVDYRLFKLKLSNEDITLSKSKPEDGETIKIFVTIHNIGNDHAKNISMKLFDNNKLLLTVNEITINANDTTTITINWTATEGSHKISFDLLYSHGPCSKEINVAEKENYFIDPMSGIFILMIIIVGSIIIWWKRRKTVI